VFHEEVHCPNLVEDCTNWEKYFNWVRKNK
jgi:hypothetical protein